MCEAHRRPLLAAPPLAAKIKATLDALHCSGDVAVTAATLMPDHLHLVMTLGPRISLSRVIAKLKAHTRGALTAVSASWQANYYEHRIRGDEAVEPFVLYLFLNPYRAHLVSLRQRWLYSWRWSEVRYRFEEAVANTGTVPIEWLDEPAPIGSSDL